MYQSSRQWILFYFCCASVLISFNISALTAVVPAISRSLNISVNDASSIIPYYMIPYGICALIYAPLASRYNIKNLMIFACLMYALGSLLSLYANSFGVIILGRIVSGVGAGAVTPLALMTLGKIFEKRVRGRVLGLFFSFSFWGSMLGLVLSGFAPWHWLFLVPVGMSVLLAVGFYFCPDEGMEANSHVKVDYFQTFRLVGLRRVLLFIFFISLLFHGVCKWYGVYLDQIYHYPQWIVSGLIILTALASSVGQILGGQITDKLGRRQACYIGVGLLSISVMMLIGHYPLIVLAIILSLISIGWCIAHNGVSTVLTDFSDTYRSELAALNSTVRFLSGGLGFYISGSFMQKNFGLTFFVIGLLMCFLIPWIHVIISKTERV